MLIIPNINNKFVSLRGTRNSVNKVSETILANDVAKDSSLQSLWHKNEKKSKGVVNLESADEGKKEASLQAIWDKISKNWKDSISLTII